MRQSFELPFLTAALSPAPVRMPVFSCAIRAGFPSPADDYVEKRLDLNDLIQHKEATYFAWVEGESMQDMNIHDGDLMMIDKAVSPESGDVVIAEIGGEFTVKKLKITGGKGYLVPANLNYPITEINPETGVSIWGVVVRVVHDLRQRQPRRKL